MKNAILQNDMYDTTRVNVFSDLTGEICGWLTGNKAHPLGGADAEFTNKESAVKYILSFFTPKKKKKKQESNQQSIF